MSRFSTLQLTLLSIVVALVLENLIGQVNEPDIAWNTPLPWLKAAVISITVLSMWSGLALTLTVSERPIAPVDFFYPFGLLLGLSLAASSLDPAFIIRFFLCLGLARLFAVWVLQSEVRFTARHNAIGPKIAVRVQAVVSALELAAAAACWLLASPPMLVLLVLILELLLEASLVAHTFAGWRLNVKARATTDA